MKPIAIKNEDGEIIEIKWDADGKIFIRHSDIDKKRFGELREYTKVAREPKFKKILKDKGVDSPMAAELMGRMGGYLVIDGESYIISAKEISMIFETVKLNGGIVPNWSSSV